MADEVEVRPYETCELKPGKTATLDAADLREHPEALPLLRRFLEAAGG